MKTWKRTASHQNVDYACAMAASTVHFMALGVYLLHLQRVDESETHDNDVEVM